MSNTLNKFALPARMSMELGVKAIELLFDRELEQDGGSTSESACYALVHLMNFSWSQSTVFPVEAFVAYLAQRGPAAPESFSTCVRIAKANRHVDSNDAEAMSSLGRWVNTLESLGHLVGQRPAPALEALYSQSLTDLRARLAKPVDQYDTRLLRVLYLLTQEDAMLCIENSRHMTRNSPDRRDGDDEAPVLLVNEDGSPRGVFPSRAAAIRFNLRGKARAIAPREVEVKEVPKPAAATTPAAVPAFSGPTLQVFNPEQARAQFEQLGPKTPSEPPTSQAIWLDAMSSDPGLRVLTEVPEGDPLASMYRRFPHFEEVLDFVSNSLALAACGDEGRQARIAPLLLRGSPGTGKTYFAQELARALNVHFVERDLSITSEAWVISGIGPTWRGAKPGVVFEAIVNGTTANPLILLNEVDKAKVTADHNSPIAPMYALLEQTSASRFMDEHVPVDIDASRVIWVLTANDGVIPEPVLSRLEVFNIREPNQEECRAIGASVWESLCNSTLPRGHGFSLTLPESVLDAISVMNPRVMRKALTRAAGTAVLAGRKALEADDLQSANKRYAAVETKRPIGFLTQAPAQA